jgi:formate dehydrogenase subunit gamma
MNTCVPNPENKGGAMTLITKMRMTHLAALALGLLLPWGAMAQQQAAPAQVPAEAAKPATPAAGAAVREWNIPPAWSEVERKPQYASIPGAETNVLIQDGGQTWRRLHNGPVTFYGGIVILVVPALLLLFYLAKGPLKTPDKPTGRVIERFNSAERVAHWTMGLSFVALALTGMTTLFGKHVLLPWLAPSVFSTLSEIGKNVHNFVGPLFIFSLVVFIVMYLKDHLWAPGDMEWLKNFGGMLSPKHIPAGRFNAGQKVWFWVGVIVLGIAASASGTVMLFPNWNTSRELMGQVNLIHAVVACIFIAMATAHIYLGTAGMEGAYKGMREGFVDESWAKEHHQLWYDDVKAGKRHEKVVGAAQAAAGDD